MKWWLQQRVKKAELAPSAELRRHRLWRSQKDAQLAQSWRDWRLELDSVGENSTTVNYCGEKSDERSRVEAGGNSNSRENGNATRLGYVKV